MKLWILPVLVYLARVAYPVTQVVNSLKTIYNVALGLSNWGLIHDILALPDSEGGMGLAMPRDFSLWHHSALFIQGVFRPQTIPCGVQEEFDRWPSQGV